VRDFEPVARAVGERADADDVLRLAFDVARPVRRPEGHPDGGAVARLVEVERHGIPRRPLGRSEFDANAAARRERDHVVAHRAPRDLARRARRRRLAREGQALGLGEHLFEPLGRLVAVRRHGPPHRLVDGGDLFGLPARLTQIWPVAERAAVVAERELVERGRAGLVIDVAAREVGFGRRGAVGLRRAGRGESGLGPRDAEV
jgi:hypothetical protein